jgi:hypothetical protein
VIPDACDADRVVRLLPDILRPTGATMNGRPGGRPITVTALSLVHDLDATMMILIWNPGTAAILVGLGGLFGRCLFSWVAPPSHQSIRRTSLKPALILVAFPSVSLLLRRRPGLARNGPDDRFWSCLQRASWSWLRLPISTSYLGCFP